MSKEPLRLHLRHPPTPEGAPKLAETIVAAAAKVSGAHLDHSPGSPAAVDDIIESYRRQGLALGKVAETLFCLGCYVGEVMVVRLGVRWRPTEETAMRGRSGMPMVVELPGVGFCDPIGAVIAQFERGEVDSIVYFYKRWAAWMRRAGSG